MILDELLRIVTALEHKELIRFNVLRDKVVEVAGSTLRSCLKPSNKVKKTKS